MKDLFGNEIPEPVIVERTGNAKRNITPKGYAATPGTGPAKQTCKTCAHIVGTGHAGRYKKCEVIRHRWTRGYGTDILAKSPACKFWKPKES